MNGNFEFDKASYPYGTVNVGNGVRLVYIPTLDVLWGAVLPPAVANTVALRFNTVYHSKDTAESRGAQIADLKANIKTVVAEAARAAYDQKLITGPVYDQVKHLTE